MVSYIGPYPGWVSPSSYGLSSLTELPPPIYTKVVKHTFEPIRFDSNEYENDSQVHPCVDPALPSCAARRPQPCIILKNIFRKSLTFMFHLVTHEHSTRKDESTVPMHFCAITRLASPCRSIDSVSSSRRVPPQQRTQTDRGPSASS